MKTVLYYLSLSYLVIAAIVYIITLLVIFLDKEKRFFGHVASLSSNRAVQMFTAFLTPAVFALGWLFLFPFACNRK